MKKTLIAYYSFSGNTRALADMIAHQIGGEIRELHPRNAYAFNYNTASKEVRSEIVCGFCPELVSGNESISEYDIVFIGSPNWFNRLRRQYCHF